MANIELDGANKKIKVDSGDLTLDVPGDIILDADGADLVFADGGTNILKVTNSSSDTIFQPQVDAKDIIFKQYDGTTVATVEDNGTFNIPASKLAIGGTAVTSTAAELNILDGVTSTAAELNIMDGVTSTTSELNILDGVTATASELNLLDGGTSVGSSITLADADGFVVNDGGTMKTIPASDISAYAGGTLVQTGTSFFESSQSSDTITLSNCFSATYDHYILYMYLLTSSNGANVNMDVASSGGNYQSLFNYSSRYFDSDGNSGSHTGQSTSFVTLGTCSSNPRDGGLAGILHFHTNNNHSSASTSGAFNCQGFYRSVATNNDQTVRAYYHGSYFRDTGDNNVPINLLFSPSSGNWEQASLKMFGVKGSAS